MLYNLRNIIKKELILIVRHRGAIFASMCLPFLLYGIFAFSFSGMMHREADISPMKVAVVDKEKSTMSRALINNFMNNKSFSNMVNIESTDMDSALRRFDNNEFTGIIIIPEKFSSSLIYIENYPLQVILNKREPLKSAVLKNMMESYGVYVSSVERSIVAFVGFLSDYDFTQKELDSKNEQMSLDLIFTALSRGQIFAEQDLNNIPPSTAAEYFIAAILVLLLMYNGVTSGNYLLEDINNGCLRRTAASSCGILTTLFGKLIAFTIFGFGESMLFILPISYFAGLFKGFFLQDLLIYIFISIMFITAISLFIATFFHREEVFITIGNMYVFICALAGGSFLPLQLMPVEIQKIASFTPNYWIIRGSLYLVNYFPLKSINGIIITLLSVSAVLMVLTALRLRKVVKT